MMNRNSVTIPGLVFPSYISVIKKLSCHCLDIDHTPFNTGSALSAFHIDFHAVHLQVAGGIVTHKSQMGALKCVAATSLTKDAQPSSEQNLDREQILLSPENFLNHPSLPSPGRPVGSGRLRGSHTTCEWQSHEVPALGPGFFAAPRPL